MPFDEVGMSGEGTLEEYFTHKTESDVVPAMPDGERSDGLTPEMEKLISEMSAATDERDSAVERLCLQLFADFSGLSKTDVIRVNFPEPDYDSERKAKKVLRDAYKDAKSGGLVLLGWQPDDPIYALYKDGQPIAAFYASYRGCYQAGGYIHEGAKEYFAHDAFKEDYAGPQNVWQERSNTCADIARDFLLGRR